jgi:SAM-dependent methyltransferase
MEKNEPLQLESAVDNDLKQWFSTPLGSMLLDQESEALKSALSGVFGHYLVQVGFPDLEKESIAYDSLKFHVLAAPGTPDRERSRWIRTDPSRLPIATDSIDAVLIQHTLDFYPHQVLREADRILIPEGRLIILGFNPWSLWGLWRVFRRRSGRVPWCGRFLSLGRVTDWLSLLGFDVESTDALMFRPPLRHKGLMNRFAIMERLGARWWPIMSGVYLLVAVKRVSTLTPLKPGWKLPTGILGGRAIEPTTRNGRG